MSGLFNRGKEHTTEGFGEVGEEVDNHVRLRIQIILGML